MAQADKSKFLSKLARFVANPTTDWAALDAAKAGQQGHASGGEGLELTQAEILAIRHQRRKDNRNIRIKEFAMLRQVRAGASAPNAHSMVSTHSKQSVNLESAEAAETAKVAAIQKPTLIANFSDKIDRIEQQMAEQWWDSVDKTKPLRTQIPIQQKEVPKTQMLIETRIVDFNAPDEVQNSDVIAFDPSMLEGLPVQPVKPAVMPVAAQPGPAQSAAQPVPAQPAAVVQPHMSPHHPQAMQAVVPHMHAPAAPVHPRQPVAQQPVQAHAPAFVPTPVMHQTQTVVPDASVAQVVAQVPLHAGAPAHLAPQAVPQAMQPLPEQAASGAIHPQAPVAPQQPYGAAPGVTGHAVQSAVSQPVQLVSTPVVHPAQVMPAGPAAMASVSTVSAATPSADVAPVQPMPATIHTPVAPVAPASSPVVAASTHSQMVAASPVDPAPKSAAPVRQGGYVPASPVHGTGEQVDFSAEQSSVRGASTFVYRDAFTEFPPEEAHDGPTSGGLLAEGELPLHPLADADSRSMAEAQAQLYRDPSLPAGVHIPPEYTPGDLPECLNEPAILFVQGQLEQAEAQLLELARAEQLRAQMGQHQDEEPHVLLALLDFYRCTEQEEKFEAASIEMVRYFDRSAPQYQGADLGEATRILSTLGSFADIDYSIQNGWRCPAELDLTDVMLLRAQLMTQPPQVLLDWQMLHTILDDAVEPLLDQFRDLAGRKVDLLMWGSEQLLACCVRKIEEQNNVPSPLLSLLWLLRLELVRIMHGQEAFDQLALDYCVALEESPPSWARTRCNYIDADNALSMLDGKQEDSALAHAADLSKDEEITLKHPLQWKGIFQGNIQALLHAVSNECQGEFCTIDCSQFNGMDYPAAVALLEWLMEPQNAQRKIQFVQVNRLLAVFWRVMGITAQVTVKLRRD